MIVVAIIAVLASIALAGFIRARKRAQATRVLNDLRMIDAAIDQYAVDNNKTAGMNPVWSDLKVYTKKNTNLYNTGADVFGETYGPFTVDTLPAVPSSTRVILSDVADTSFWSPYQ